MNPGTRSSNFLGVEPYMKKLMTGNEAAARGAFEAGAVFASGYPGTPATEILETLSHYPDVYAEWSANEKIAIEMASGASFAGKRAIVIMKHVGLNVASDPLMTLSYTGVRGGLVIVVSDDPGMHSSQNEQDSRLYSKMAKIPMLEPSDSNEALLLTKEAFTISETLDTPVLLRLTASISHTSSIVETGERVDTKDIEIKKEPEKYVMLPPFCNKRKIELENRWKRLQAFSESFRFNRIEYNSPLIPPLIRGDTEGLKGDFNHIGIITSGISYQYVKEAMPHAFVLKLAMTSPLPLNLIKKFSEKVKKLFVIEELEPFIEDTIRAEGIDVIGKKQGLSSYGELSALAVKDFIINEKSHHENDITQGSGTFCPGCPYLGLFYCLQRLLPKLSRRHGCFVFGDIGCYTLGARIFPGSIDTTLCMGAGISQAAGFLKASERKKAIAIIGDSTFFHSGIHAIVNAVYHRVPLTIIILDNGTTAMTGGQPYAGIDIHLRGLLKTIGIKKITEITPYDISLIKDAIESSLSFSEISAIILKGKCIVKGEWNSLKLDEMRCDGCGECMEIKCPALRSGDGKILIDATCTGCGLCISLCQRGAIG